MDLYFTYNLNDNTVKTYGTIEERDKYLTKTIPECISNRLPLSTIKDILTGIVTQRINHSGIIAYYNELSKTNNTSYHSDTTSDWVQGKLF
jgi:hypothetical protein